jgi:ABC-2 type transport system permease protein
MALAFVPALALSILLRFLVDWTVAMIAFWTSRMSAIDQMYYVVVIFVSGQVAPLALLPSPVRLLATLLPFRWMVSFPVELLLGRLSVHDALIGFAALGAWLGLALILLTFTWRVGLRRYSAVGS